ncbi:hypothetical protein VB264_18530 [Arcicella aquatica]|uniref:Uncharacterized protein n=1 Tax=Arcicella aquatica TaxID=217141 RepID=A0ABU5QRT0_9BACT|nr:hypothetical protein [Arcicella aquatica]MEA5259800.1 hypothetical protein [Arcicella aquatica]
MKQLDYKKVFSKLSHIKALSHDEKFDQIVQNLITHTLTNICEKNPKNEVDVENKIKEIYGISIRNSVITSNIDKLLDKKEIIRDRNSSEYFVTPEISIKLKKRLDDANNLENNVRLEWFQEIKKFINDISDEGLEKLWDLLKLYLSNVFEQHGMQTLNFLNPNIRINEDDQKSLVVIVESILRENGNPFTKEILSSSINQFIINANEIRASYISQLADATFTSFALTSDAETVNFLNKRYNKLDLFLDTNFIFGILDLHKNSEDASAREILEEVKKNRLPFKLTYHPETLAEFKRAFDARALYIRATKWTRESSRVAIIVDGLSPLEELFHKQNIENEIDPAIFLEKYDHVDLILKDLGLIEYIPRKSTDNELVDIECDIEAYQKFYDEVKNRKPKSFSGFKHDVIALTEVRALNPKKTKFLESNAFFISSDFILAKFERTHYKRSWEINYVVSPSVFLQLIRPFIENDYSANKRFIDTFSIPEFRSFEIDYSTTRSKALQIINDNYHATSFETKVNILRDQVLLDKLNRVNDDYEKQNAIIESYIAIENQFLAKKNEEVKQNIKSVIIEKELLETKKIIAEQNIKDFKQENENLMTEKTLAIKDANDKKNEIDLLNSKLANIERVLENQQLENKYLKDLEKWKHNRILYIESHIKDKRLEYKLASKYCIRPSVVLLLVSILTPIIVRYYSEIKSYIELKGYSEFYLMSLITILAILAGYDLLYRTYIVDKDKVKMGLHWIKTFGLNKNKKKLLEAYQNQFGNEYNKLHIQPKLRV